MEAAIPDAVSSTIEYAGQCGGKESRGQPRLPNRSYTPYVPAQNCSIFNQNQMPGIQAQALGILRKAAGQQAGYFMLTTQTRHSGDKFVWNEFGRTLVRPKGADHGWSATGPESINQLIFNEKIKGHTKEGDGEINEI